MKQRERGRTAGYADIEEEERTVFRGPETTDEHNQVRTAMEDDGR